jgi:hypothetical protein
MILLKYPKYGNVNYERKGYPSGKALTEWEEVNGPVDELDSTYLQWRVFRFIDEELATAFRMKFPKT